VFTARYGLSPCIKQIRFVFKGLISLACRAHSSNSTVLIKSVLSSPGYNGVKGVDWIQFITIRLFMWLCRGWRVYRKTQLDWNITLTGVGLVWGDTTVVYLSVRNMDRTALGRPGRGAGHPIPSSCRGSQTGRTKHLLPLLGPQGLL
jgi:hypothetical protein